MSNSESRKRLAGYVTDDTATQLVAAAVEAERERIAEKLEKLASQLQPSSPHWVGVIHGLRSAAKIVREETPR